MKESEMNDDEMTPCQRLGYKVGDVFVVCNPDESQGVPVGTRLILDHDDGSVLPYFRPEVEDDPFLPYALRYQETFCMYIEDGVDDVVDVMPLSEWEATCGAVQDDAPGGSTPSQYGIPAGAKDLQDLIEYREMNFALGNIFKACYRRGTCSHSDELRDMRKIKWFAEREIARLEREEVGNDGYPDA